ncbi:hypothetical protein F5Y07DRAFT_348058 [Xylaria sp. FL0933]|nr:hypothetical protein F5Y07DRAFT_348058 [Xylaria sp. FL0933]
MSSIAPEDIVALATNVLSLLVEILSLVLAYRTFQSTRSRRRQEHRFVVERRRTAR